MNTIADLERSLTDLQRMRKKAQHDLLIAKAESALMDRSAACVQAWIERTSEDQERIDQFCAQTRNLMGAE
jgi:hypothetical protein